MKLVDASVALKWFLDEQHGDVARMLAERNDLCAPVHIIAEVLNGLWKNKARGVISSKAVLRAVPVLPPHFAELTELTPLSLAAVRISLELDHPVYDCLYLADAERRRMPVVTADLKLLNRLKNTRFQRLAEPLQ